MNSHDLWKVGKSLGSAGVRLYGPEEAAKALEVEVGEIKILTQKEPLFPKPLAIIGSGTNAVPLWSYGQLHRWLVIDSKRQREEMK